MVPVILYRRDLQALLASYTQCCHSAVTDSQASDEFLYGRVGTLFGALLLNHTFGPTAVSHDTMEQLVQAVLQSGMLQEATAEFRRLVVPGVVQAAWQAWHALCIWE